MIRKENKTLFGIKLIASIFVVFIHSMFPGIFGVIMKNIARFAVPFFFIVSGYYWYTPELNRGGYCVKLKRRSVKIGRLTVYAFSLYLIVNIGLHFLQGELKAFLIEIMNIKNWILLVACNYTTPILGVGHLWYIAALFYVYYVVAYIEKKQRWNNSYIMAVAFIGITLVLEIISLHAKISIPAYIYRNWLFTGFPLFTIGHYIRKHEKSVRELNSFFLITTTRFFR